MSLSETTTDKNNRFRDVNRTEKHGDGKEFLIVKTLTNWQYNPVQMAMEMNGNYI